MWRLYCVHRAGVGQHIFDGLLQHPNQVADGHGFVQLGLARVPVLERFQLLDQLLTPCADLLLGLLLNRRPFPFVAFQQLAGLAGELRWIPRAAAPVIGAPGKAIPCPKSNGTGVPTPGAGTKTPIPISPSWP